MESPASLAASKDNTLYEDATGSLSNGAGTDFFVGRTSNGSIRRGMIAFDIAGNIPDGATISSVSLTLRVSRTMVEASTIQLHRLLADWGEGIGVSAGGGGSGAIAAAGDATWVHKFFDTARWATRGGDFSDTISASVSVEGVGSYTWGSTDQMVADVQSWLDDPSSNFGWLLKGDEGVRSAKKFASRETPGAGDRPVLVVEFTP